MPKLDPGLDFVSALYLAHLDHRREKVAGFGVAFGAVPLSEIWALLQLMEVRSNAWRYQLLRFWEAMDGEFVAYLKAEADKEREK